MKANKLKLLSIAICWTVSALCSVIQCMEQDTLDNYVKARSSIGEKVKMILGCGHTPSDDYVYSKSSSTGPNTTHDINGKGKFHEHTGWYTVDKNSDRKPDLTMDINSSEFLNILSSKNGIFDLIYAEYLPPEILSDEVLTAVFSSLKQGGKFVFQILPSNFAVDIYPTESDKDLWLSRCNKIGSEINVQTTVYYNSDRIIFDYKLSKRVGIQDDKIINPTYVKIEKVKDKDEEFIISYSHPRLTKDQINFKIKEDMNNNLSVFDEMFKTACLPFCYAIAEKN